MIGLIGLLRFKWTYLVIGVVLVGIGAVSYLSAHPSQPAEVDGTITSYVEYTRNGAYDRNELQIQGDSNTYTLDKNSFHPALPDAVFKDGKVNFWIDQGSTTVIAITLYDTNDANPVKYTTDHYDNPASERSDTQTAGITAGVIGAIFLVVFALWFVVGQRRRTGTQMAGGALMGLPMAVPQAPSVSGTSVGVSSDGKWYWDGAQWRQVSDDGRYRWDGAAWQELGVVYSAKGAPPPPTA